MSYRDVYLNGVRVGRDFWQADGSFIRALPFNRFGDVSNPGLQPPPPRSPLPRAWLMRRGKSK